ncbi:MAG TPA: DoxX family protein [Saprospiraceae bacterium]|nr:DoxX family protein [Saprospiraceae bacterium]
MFGKKTDIALLILRLTFGGLMLAAHGWPKFQKLLGTAPVEFSDPLGIGVQNSLISAVFAEVVCSIFVVLGWFTRWALIPLIFTMLVAIFLIHWDDPFQKMEKAIIFCAGYLSIFFAGPGWYSIDEYFKK